MRYFFTIYFVVITDLLYGHLWILITEFLKGHFLYVYQIGENKNGVLLSTLVSKIHTLFFFFLQVLSLKCYLKRAICNKNDHYMMINSTGSQMGKVIVFQSHFHVNIIDYILKTCASNEAKKQKGPLEKNSYVIESNDIISRMAPGHLLLKKLTVLRLLAPVHCPQRCYCELTRKREKLI